MRNLVVNGAAIGRCVRLPARLLQFLEPNIVYEVVKYYLQLRDLYHVIHHPALYFSPHHPSTPCHVSEKQYIGPATPPW